MDKALLTAVGTALKEELIKRDARLDALESIEMPQAIHGKDSDVNEIVDALLSNELFIKSVTGKKGQSVEVNELIAKFMSDSIFMDAMKGQDGKDGKDADAVEVDIDDVTDALKADDGFIDSLKGEAGKDAEAIEPDAVVERLLDNPVLMDSVRSTG